ncbi:uncharacterized protein LOC116427505 isoform X2 [Nomia melanderi]|uniref:uncharacterized protein LOC116427505 isoform X2 n=1 Tax=Nomia melanderi TaxID=2448451 RepID=UPI00130432BA|nr:uncharacterized protein LOC116427505 isoform X2 [Nomia melanderi]
MHARTQEDSLFLAYSVSENDRASVLIVCFFDVALQSTGNRSQGPIPGCKPCTRPEITYCEDESVINDHCCCDGSVNEVFPFVKHTCRVGPEECKVHAGDCAEYARLRECCCHSYLASYWKYLANNAQSYADTCLTKFLAILVVLRLLL